MAAFSYKWAVQQSVRHFRSNILRRLSTYPKLAYDVIRDVDCEDNDVEVPSVNNASALLARCRRELSALPPLLTREFSANPTYNSRPRVRVMQWNVLSQTLGQQNDNFVACPDGALEWNTRRYRMLEEMLTYNPDVICLQEVDHFKFLQKMLGSIGYEGVFFPKPDSGCVHHEQNNGPDGCAVFHKRVRFDRTKVETRVMEVFRVRSNQVAVLVVLRLRDTGEELCVVTTHLKARKGPLLSEVRNEQGKDLLDFVDNNYGGRPVVLCGDFNAEPSEPVYRTLLNHSQMGLASGYARYNNSGWEEPPYTTWKIREEGEECHTIDYIFYSRAHLAVDTFLDLPTREQVGANRVPSYQYASDHFSLVCDFSLKPACSIRY